jgi:hypothetical protein
MSEFGVRIKCPICKTMVGIYTTGKLRIHKRVFDKRHGKTECEGSMQLVPERPK